MSETHIGGVQYLVCLGRGVAAFLALSLACLPAAIAGTTVSGTYTATLESGDGSTISNSLIPIATSPADPLGFVASYTLGSFSASASAGIWGTGSADSSWFFWVTEGTGVSQADPGNVVINPARLTVNFDVKVEGDTYAAWYDFWNLAGTVGTGGSVGFTADERMYLYTTLSGAEQLQNSLVYSYFNDTAGSFWLSSGDLLPSPGSSFAPLAAGDYMRFVGTYVFAAENDGGPSSIYFTETPAPVPEPGTMLLLGAGLIGLAGLRRTSRK